MGQAIGRADPTNSEPTADPVGPANLLSTVVHTLFDVGRLRVARGLPPGLVRLVESAEPIHPLF